jgi:hypothetical protein
MEKTMKKSKLPGTDSIRKLAEFWDSHDVTDFEDELQEVSGPVFVAVSGITVPLESRETRAVEKLAKAQGVTREELVRGWVLKNLSPRRAATRRTKR